METRANYALIGLFTLAVIAAAVFFVTWFSGADKRSTRVVYKIVFTTSVSGLSLGSQVLFNGLKVGEVTAIDLMDDPGQVYAMIDVDRRTPVKIDTRARLEYQGLTGVASIALSGGTTGTETLQGAGIEVPVIIADRSEFQNILETVQRLSGKTEAMLGNLDQLITSNSANVTQTLASLRTFSDALTVNSDGVKEFMSGMADLGKAVKPMAENIDRLTKDIDERITAIDPKSVAGIVANVEQLSGKLNASADKIDGVLAGLTGFLSGADGKGMFGDVGDAAKSIRKLADNLDLRTKDLTASITRFTGPGLRQYEALAADGRRTLDEINRTLRSLEKNPQQLIFGSKPKIPEYSGR